MTTAKLTSAEKRIVRAFDRYFGEGCVFADYEHELLRVAAELGKAHSKNAKALAALEESARLSWATAEVMAGRQSKELDDYLAQFAPKADR